MRIVIDLQSAQSPSSKFGGVGRYAREITKALLKNKEKTDEIFIALNGFYSNEVIELKNYFNNLLPDANIKVWNWYLKIPPAICSDIQKNKPAIFFHEWFLHQFNADIIFTINFQEGLSFPGLVTSINETRGPELSFAILHDISPIIIPNMHPSIDVSKWYYKMIDYCKKADGLITVSEFSKENIIKKLSYDKNNIIVASPGINKDEFCSKKVKKEKMILYIGGASEYKNVELLVCAFSKLPNSIKSSYYLCLAGKDFEHRKKYFLNLAKRYGISSRFIIFGELSDNGISKLMQKSSLFVFPSLAEGFGMPPAEAISCGTLSLVSNATSLPEVVGTDFATFDPKNSSDLANKIAKFLNDKNAAHELFLKEKENIKKFNWDESAKKILCFFKRKLTEKNKKISKKYDIYDFKKFCSGTFSDLDAKLIAKSFADSKIFSFVKHIYIDLSAVVIEDYVTGIQRVCNAIVNNFNDILSKSEKYKVIPIYSSPDKNYFIKCSLVKSKFTQTRKISPKEIVQFSDGDILFMPDLHPSNIITKTPYLRQLVNRGVKVYTLLHDIIPTHFPNYFSKDFVREFNGYLKSIAQFSGVIANSKTTLYDYLSWCKINKIKFNKFFKTDYCYLGSDVSKANPTPLKKDENINDLISFEKTTTFLVVGTIEPRKMHQQILKAFDILWKKGYNFNLVFVGRYGWKMTEFLDTIKNHNELGKKFFWYKNVSDEYLDMLYSKSSAVIVASLIEGFGLPIMEGRYHKKPLILRDIPIFREIANDNAMYFSGTKPTALSNVIEKWYQLYIHKKEPSSNNINLIKWHESAENFLDKLDIHY